MIMWRVYGGKYHLLFGLSFVITALFIIIGLDKKSSIAHIFVNAINLKIDRCVEILLRFTFISIYIHTYIDCTHHKSNGRKSGLCVYYCINKRKLTFDCCVINKTNRQWWVQKYDCMDWVMLLNCYKWSLH